MKLHIAIFAMTILSTIAWGQSIQFVKPYIGAETGIVSAEDDTKITGNILGEQTLIHINGAGAHGNVYGVNTGMGARWYNLYAGVNGEYQRQEISQSFSASAADGSIFRSTGGMWSSYTASLRLGYYILPQALIFIGAGRVWSKAGSTLHDDLLNEESKDTINQDGYLWSIGATIMPWEHWGIDLTAQKANYRSLSLPSPLTRVAKLRVASKNVGALLGVSYHF